MSLKLLVLVIRNQEHIELAPRDGDHGRGIADAAHLDNGTYLSGADVLGDRRIWKVASARREQAGGNRKWSAENWKSTMREH